MLRMNCSSFLCWRDMSPNSGSESVSYSWIWLGGSKFMFKDLMPCSICFSVLWASSRVHNWYPISSMDVRGFKSIISESLKLSPSSSILSFNFIKTLSVLFVSKSRQLALTLCFLSISKYSVFFSNSFRNSRSTSLVILLRRSRARILKLAAVFGYSEHNSLNLLLLMHIILVGSYSWPGSKYVL